MLHLDIGSLSGRLEPANFRYNELSRETVPKPDTGTDRAVAREYK